MSLTRVLYRQLLRLARDHDRHAALKALMVHPRLQWQQTQMRIGAASASSSKRSSAPFQVMPSPSGGMIIVGSMKNMQQRGGIESIIKRILSGEEISKEEEEDDEDEDAEEEDDGSGWNKTVSDAYARWMHRFFQDRDFYLPTSLIEEIVRSEFRLPLPVTASPSAAASSTAATAASHTRSKSSTAVASKKSPLPISPLAQLTTDAFGILRILNKNAVEGTERKLRFSEEKVREDPAFRSEVAPQARPPAVAPAEIIGESSSSSVDAPSASSFDEFSMRPTSVLRAGCFLVAHPQLDGTTFERTVILLHRAGDPVEGSAGWIINAPYSRSPAATSAFSAFSAAADASTDTDTSAAADSSSPFAATNLLGERLKRMKLGDPLRAFRFCSMQEGGPVLWRGRSTLATGDHPSVTILHRHPALAGMSTQIINEGSYPVWKLPFNKIDAAATLLAAADAAASFAATAVASADSSATAAIPASTEPLFDSSDLIAYNGSAEWSPGQLEGELKRGSWILVEGSGAHVFTARGTPDQIASAVAVAQAAAKKDAKKISKKAAAAAVTTTMDSADSSIPSSPAPPRPLLPLPNRPTRAFPLAHVWSHAMHVHGGEYRHFAHMPIKRD